MNATYDRVVAEMLRRQSDAIEAGPDSPELRKQLASAIDDAIAANRASSSRRDTEPATRSVSTLRLVLAGIAALLVILFGAAWLMKRMSPDETHEVTPAAPLELALAGGGRLVKGPSARVDVSGDGAVATLRMGEVAAEVYEQELRIDTTDAQIFVRQAKVSLETGAGCDGRVRVTVQEGSARVKVAAKEVTLAEGEVWPSCAAAKEEPVEPVKPPPAKLEKPLSLDEQNAMFQHAVELQRDGEVLEAAALLERIVQKFPMGSARADAEKLVAP
jgi:ferric-dicitrate binding protein FerR (iron transport regulator)